MNNTQKKYAIERITAVEKIKYREADEFYRTEGTRISDDKKMELIFSGKVKLRPHKDIGPYTDLRLAFDFSEHEIESGHRKGYEELMKKIHIMSRDARDQIMLGDCEEAMKLIQSLEDLKIKS